MNTWDVIVVGGGPSGSVCAGLLASAGWRVLLAEAGDSGRERIADTLCPAAVRRLRAFLVMGDLPAMVAVPCRGVVAQWGAGDVRVTDYELDARGSGLTVARPAMDLLMRARAARLGAETRLGWRADSVCSRGLSSDSMVSFATPSGPREEQARVLLDASGRHSTFGGGGRRYADEQIAFFTTLPACSANGLLWVEKTDAGWWYLNQVPRGAAQLVFVTGARPVHGDRRARHQFFETHFSNCRFLRNALPALPTATAIRVCDARLSEKSAETAGGPLCLGDAAATCDPLSGQGWLRALESATRAAEGISQRLRSEALGGLAEFADWQRSEAAAHSAARTFYQTRDFFSPMPPGPARVATDFSIIP